MAHWHVLGTGAIGCLFSARLAQAGVPVTLLPRQAVADEGPVTVRVSGPSGDSNIPIPWEPAGSHGAIDYLLVTTKAYDAAAAVTSVAPRLHRGSVLLLMTNGLGCAEEVRTVLPDMKPVLGTTTAGAYRAAPWHIHPAGAGTTRLGCPGANGAPTWFDAWQHAIPACTWDPAIDSALWRKLAINCAINPLTAVHKCPNGELGTTPALAAQVRGLCVEIARVGRAAGHPAAVEDLEAAVFAVIQDTAGNRSSMLQDLLAGRRTEIDYITGYLVATAHKLGEPVPGNRELLARVRQLETRALAAI